jgi:hypothetical protein
MRTKLCALLALGTLLLTASSLGAQDPATGRGPGGPCDPTCVNPGPHRNAQGGPGGLRLRRGAGGQHRQGVCDPRGGGGRGPCAGAPTRTQAGPGAKQRRGS